MIINKSETQQTTPQKHESQEIDELLDVYEKENAKFNLEKIQLKNTMNYELNCKIIEFYKTYKKNHKLNVDSYFVALINNYMKNHIRLIYFTIDLYYNRILQIAKKIADLRLQNYILLNKEESIKDITLQIKALEFIEIETEKIHAEYTSIDEDYIKYITQINASEKNECYICYESMLLYRFYDCAHVLCNDCYNKIKTKICPLCKEAVTHTH